MKMLKTFLVYFFTINVFAFLKVYPSGMVAVTTPLGTEFATTVAEHSYTPAGYMNISSTGGVSYTRLPLTSVWHEDYQMIAHALGVVDGNAETNSREAFLSTYEAGFRLFEADFQLTLDNYLVVRHDFEQISYANLKQTVLNGETRMNLDRFVIEKIIYDYHSLTVHDLVALLAEHDDAYLITDTKELDQAVVQEQFHQLVDAVYEWGDESLFQRIIVQIYYDEMYEMVREIHPFSQWIYTLYQQYDPNIEEIGRFCADHGIEVVTMPHGSATAEKSQILHGYGLKVFTHTINERSQLLEGKEMGVDGFYTDFLLADEYYREYHDE